MKEWVTPLVLQVGRNPHTSVLQLHSNSNVFHPFLKRPPKR
jgi:hypothetical protein